MSTWQVRESDVVLEDAGEREWVFTLHHTDQATEEVSVTLTHVEGHNHPVGFSLKQLLLTFLGPAQPDDLPAQSSRDDGRRVGPPRRTLAPENKARSDSSQTRRNRKTR